MRVAVFNRDNCQPNKCSSSVNKPCIKYCPMVRTGKETIVLAKDGFPVLTEALCTGCGICVKKCPFHCYIIVNLPEELEKELTHRYTKDGFKLYRMLIPRKGKVLGVIGQNGIGKSTCVKILSGQIKVNFGRFGEDAPDWEEIITYYRGSELQKYFTDIRDKKVKVVYKPQEITKIPEQVKGKVNEILKKVDTAKNQQFFDEITRSLNLTKILDRDIGVLSGGELQKVAIAAAVLKDGYCYLFDEPSSYLDIRERLNMAQIIRNLSKRGEGSNVVVVEHDMAILDYLSDQVCLMYGEPSAYGIVSHPYGVRTGINSYMEGYIRDENMKFREEAIKFNERPPFESLFSKGNVIFEFGNMKKKLGDFSLEIYGGEIHGGEVVGIMGPNGIGKTTFINMIAGKLQPDEGSVQLKTLKISYKPQYIDLPKDKNASEVIRKIKLAPFDAPYIKRIITSFNLEVLEEKLIGELSGGELQRLAIADCLTNEADIYLLDEPSAFLDIEMRLKMALVIRRSIESIKKAAFVVEHDIVTQDFICDSLIVFNGEPGLKGIASPPMSLRDGMNQFLKEMNITFRRDLITGRPRVNKLGSKLDKMQRSINEYYYIPTKIEKDDEE
jgi:ATP-binding cassette subfamily E protein 1